MARNDTPNRTAAAAARIAEKSVKTNSNPAAPCSICGANLEPVGNRLFLIYKRARLPQPKSDASVCSACGWVEGDTSFQALLEERFNHR